MLSISNHDFWTVFVWEPKMHFELIRSQQNLLLTEQISLLGAICTSKSFFPTTFSIILSVSSGGIKNKIKSTQKWWAEQKYSFSAVYAININIIAMPLARCSALQSKQDTAAWCWQKSSKGGSREGIQRLSLSFKKPSSSTLEITWQLFFAHPCTMGKPKVGADKRTE